MEAAAAPPTGYQQIVEWLLGAGADVELATNDGWIPLHEACFNGHAEIARQLIALGSQVGF